MRLFLLFLLTSMMAIQASGQRDLSSYVKPVYKGEESTGLSIFDTNPESPDGKFLADQNTTAIA